MNKKKGRKKKRFPYILILLITVLIGTASWAFYSIINNGVKDLLSIIKIENLYLQGGIIILIVLAILILLGFGFKKSLGRIIK